MTNYIWIFKNFTVNPSTDGLTNVVTAIEYILQASENDNQAYRTGVVSLDPANPNEFIPFDQITSVMAQQWCEAKLPMPILYAELDQILHAQNLPLVPPPFVPVPVPPPVPPQPDLSFMPDETTISVTNSPQT